MFLGVVGANALQRVSHSDDETAPQRNFTSIYSTFNLNHVNKPQKLADNNSRSIFATTSDSVLYKSHPSSKVKI